MLEAGDAMPKLTVTDGEGQTRDMADFLGKPLVLWFYPKDDTPG